MDSNATKVVSTGVSGLDEILQGGLPRRRVYLVQGGPGAGKTTLGLQFLLEGARRGEGALYVTLSETPDELQAISASHGWTLDGITVHPLSTPEEMLQAEKRNTLFHPAEVELNETVSRVLELVDKLKPSRIVFDSLSEMRLLAGDSLRYRRQILSLKQQFASRSATVLFLDDGAFENANFQVQSIAHGVIALERDTPEYGAVRRRLEVIKLRGVDFVTGKHDFFIQPSGLRVFPRLVAAKSGETFRPEVIPIGIAGLDALLGGGLERGTSAILLGPAGAGKSSVALQYALAFSRRNERTAFFTFDENLRTLISRASKMGLKIDSDSQQLAQARQINPAELSPGEFADEVQRAVEHDGARLVVIDSLNGYLMSMRGERFLLAHMHELLAYLGQRGVLTLLITAQHGLIRDMHAPIDITYLADTVVLFRFYEARGSVHKAISVVKKRAGGHESTLRHFEALEKGVQVGDPLSDFRGVLTGIPELSDAAPAKGPS